VSEIDAGQPSRIAGLRYRTRIAVGSSNVLFPLTRLLTRDNPNWMIGGETDVCIEGYPRSGNSFVYRAFQGWNPAARVAHHLHVPVQVKRAVAMGIPTAVLIRAPAEAVPSLSVYFEGRVAEDTLLETYVAFYRALWPIRSEFVISPFDETVADPTRLPAELNKKFGSHFAAGDWDAGSQTALREELAFHHRSVRNGLDSRFPLPTSAKEVAKAHVRVAIENNARFPSAVEVHDRFVGGR
jgi:hypothetical protein